MRPLLYHPGKAPDWKLRGKRRYFQRVQRKADAFVLEPDPHGEFWHYHADWKGWGNLGWKYRGPHVEALCTVFRKICEARDQLSTPYQTWIVLDGEDAGQDATYLHTPNPRDTFPLILLTPNGAPRRRCPWSRLSCRTCGWNPDGPAS